VRRRQRHNHPPCRVRTPVRFPLREKPGKADGLRWCDRASQRYSSVVSAISDDLARVPLFADLGRRDLKELANLFRERTLRPGTKPVQEGKMSGIGFFVIVDGEAAVSIGDTVVATLRPGDHFGEVALISRRERTATVTATTPLRVLVIQFYDFREFALANPAVMWKLLEHVVARAYPDVSRTS
jgi:CRP/FNR family transcriptional regulator, cyclic AMP receptor protein